MERVTLNPEKGFSELVNFYRNYSSSGTLPEEAHLVLLHKPGKAMQALVLECNREEEQ